MVALLKSARLTGTDPANTAGPHVKQPVPSGVSEQNLRVKRDGRAITMPKIGCFNKSDTAADAAPIWIFKNNEYLFWSKVDGYDSRLPARAPHPV
jgi:hypothetical protein